jgi:hypothetical protein
MLLLAAAAIGCAGSPDVDEVAIGSEVQLTRRDAASSKAS